MARFEISVTADYVPTWGLQEAVREFLHNAKDEEERDPTHAMRVSYSSRGGGKLAISSEGVVLDRSVLLLGASGKRDDAQARGKFGEGLDLALLALVRAGHGCRIENGGESWSPALEYSDTWGATVLTVQTHALQQPRGAFRVEIDGVLPGQWRTVVHRCLFIQGAVPASEPVLRVGQEQILLDRPGEIYAGGLWVGKFSDFSCGYDLRGLELDRDRKMVGPYMLGIHGGRAWVGALANPALRAVALASISGFFAGNRRDGEWIAWALANTYTGDAREAKKALAEDFRAKWGDKAVPVLSTDEADRARNAGLVPVLMEKGAKDALEVALGRTLEEALAEANKALVRVLGPDEIDRLGWRSRWEFILALAAELGFAIPLSVAEMANADVYGQYRGQDIVLSSRCFAEAAPGQAIVTLVHEWAHARVDRDGHGRQHGEMSENVMALVLNRFLRWPA